MLQKMPRLPALPLRMRVTLLFALMGLVMTLLFAGMVTFITEDYEGILVEEILRSQADDYTQRLQEDPDMTLPRSRRLSGYLQRKDGTSDVPKAFAALPPGIHETSHSDANGLHIGVFDTPRGRLFFVIDLKDIEQLESYMHLILVAVILLGTLVSTWLGWLFSGGVVRPVRRLADEIDGLPAQPTLTTLAARFPRDELGRLGKAIDDYQARLVAAEASERAFFADASHELRTPIAVVRGATELLLEDSADLPQLQPRLQRLDRGMQQVSELLDALLGLARHRVAAPETVDLRDWLGYCLGGFDVVRDGAVRLSLQCEPEPRVLPIHEAELVLRGIVRRLVPIGAGGTLAVVAGNGRIELWFIDDAAHAPDTPTRTQTSSDRRLGMTLIGRLATQIGWDVDDSDTISGHVLIRFTN